MVTGSPFLWNTIARILHGLRRAGVARHGVHLAGRVERLEEHLARRQHLRRVAVHREPVLAFEHVADHEAGVAVLARRLARRIGHLAGADLPAVQVDGGRRPSAPAACADGARCASCVAMNDAARPIRLAVRKSRRSFMSSSVEKALHHGDRDAGRILLRVVHGVLRHHALGSRRSCCRRCSGCDRSAGSCCSTPRCAGDGPGAK